MAHQDEDEVNGSVWVYGLLIDIQSTKGGLQLNKGNKLINTSELMMNRFYRALLSLAVVPTLWCCPCRRKCIVIR